MDSGAPWRALEIPDGTEPAGGGGPSHTAPAVRHILIGAAAVAISISVAIVVAIQLAPQGGVAIAGASEASGTNGPGDQSAPASASPSLLVIEVAGAVVRPGVYRLAAGSRVADAIAAAGGYGSDVDPRAAEGQLNLAAKLTDAQLVRIPRRGESAASAGAPGGGAATAAAGASSVGPVDLNAASADQLDALPGIGPVTAAKIVAARQERPFASVDDLLARKLVSASTLSKIRSLVVVR